MGIIRGVVVLPAAGIFTQVKIDTDINAESTSGWLITGFKGIMRSRDVTGVEVPESSVIDLILSTRVAAGTKPDEPEELARISWALAFGTNVGSTVIELNKSATDITTRITVQPNLYVSANGTVIVGSITDLYYEISYEPVKLGAVELLRLLVGGA